MTAMQDLQGSLDRQDGLMQRIKADRMAKGDIESLRCALDLRLESLRTERSSWIKQWHELSDYLQPRRGTYLVSPNQGQRGTPRANKILNPTPTNAARILASGMLAGMTSAARPWFRLSTSQCLRSSTSLTRIWLDQVVKVLQRVFSESNFYGAMAELYDELSVFQTAVMLILEDYEDVINCQTLTAGEYFLAVDHRNVVNTIYREFVMTVAQMADRFGEEVLSDSARSLNDAKQKDKEIVVCHVIEPNDRRRPAGFGWRAMPWRSVFWEKGSPRECVLEIKGYQEFPAIAVRWSKKGNDPYGTGPSTEALPDIKSLQLKEKRKAQVIDQLSAPAKVADAQLQNAGVSQLPGSITYVSNVAAVGVKTIYEPPPTAVTVVAEDIAQTENRINKIFYADLWMMMAELEGVQPRNDMEVTERRGEKLLQLGPVLENMEGELDRAIKRTFAILLRHSKPFWLMGQDGPLPVPPPELRDPNFDIQYISMLSQAQKAMATTGIEGLLAFIGSVVAVFPQAADNIDIDEAVQEYGDVLNTPPKILRDPKAVAAIRADRAKQQQQQQQMEQTLAGVQGAQVLSKTDVGQGQNALQKMLGTGP